LSPNIPYQFLSEKHLLFDLIYNPEVTAFLSQGKEKGATIKNGLEMLEMQAEESWRIWNESKL
jgi:shikimate dehydrogenase